MLTKENAMKRTSWSNLILALGAATSLLCSCNPENSPSGGREAISICAPSRNLKGFVEVVHKYYPEIVFDIDPYSGQNGTVYMENQIMTGNQPDITSISYFIADHYDISNNFIDLSSYPFTGNYVSSRLNEVNQDGKIYLLPSYYNCLGITYNKKILQDNGWELPTSFEELEALAPKVKQAGYNLALNEIGLPGYGFQYFCNILDTGYLSTPSGKKWQSDFLNERTTLSGNESMVEAMGLLQRWRDVGMLNGDMAKQEDGAVCAEFAKGNTLFLLGSTNNVEERGANIGDFGLMPYLSVDGKQNVYILQVSRYMGLSKKLLEPGNEQKLEDALHVMEILSTPEGMEALNNTLVATNISPLKEVSLAKGNFYADIIDDLNSGYTAPFIYSGWENVIPDYGNKMVSFISGETDLNSVIDFIDDNQSLLHSPVKSYTKATEVISTEACAKITGIAFAEAIDSDLSLISLGGMDMAGGGTNGDGVNGKLFPKDVTEPDIVSFLPTGWNGNIRTFTLTGKRIKELAETGFNRKDRGYFYPYVLVQRDNLELRDDATYKLAICGSTEALNEEGDVQDSGILGLKAAEDYLSKFETLREDAIDWR